MSRTIRFKEFPPNTERMLEPSEEMRAASDESLTPGPFLRRTDEHGFVVTGNSLPEAPSNLLIFGDSFVESNFADEPRRFASQLERHLHEVGKPYNVLNGGQSGMTSLHMLSLLSTKAPSFMTPGSKILLVVGQSDTNALIAPGMYWDKSRTVSPFNPPESAGGTPTREWREGFVGMVTCLVHIAKALSLDVALSSGLYRNGDFSTDSVLRRAHHSRQSVYERRFKIRRQIPAIVKALASEHGVPYFDATSPFLERPELFYDTLHLNHQGQDLYASILAEWVAGQFGKPLGM